MNKKIIIGIVMLIVVLWLIDLPAEKCIDRGGVWKYKEWKCQEPHY